MNHYEVRKIGEHRGKRRIYMEGPVPTKAGFAPGMTYNVKKVVEKSTLILEVVENGMRVVSKKRRGEKERPVIDIENSDLMEVFKGIEAVRVVVQAGRIFIMPMATEVRAKSRIERLRKKLENGEALSVGSTSSGIGILDYALHQGMMQAGVKTELAFANEIREDCMNHAIENNPGYTDKTITLTAPMQEVVFDKWAMGQLPETDIFVGGIPCSGASIAGRTKRKLEHPEDHPEVGALIVSFIAFIAHTSPSAVILENVPQYAATASMSILRNSLRDLGYDVHETELRAEEWGMLEHRRRLCMIAVSKGISFDIGAIKAPIHEKKSFGDIMEDVPLDHSTWGAIDYLWSKQERDKEAGKGFAPTVVDGNSYKVPTLNKTLHKRQSTGTFIQHPENKKLYRIPTLKEHAACKGIPFDLVGSEATQTFGHEAMGQAISVPPFVSAFKALGEALLKSIKESASNFSLSLHGNVAVG